MVSYTLDPTLAKKGSQAGGNFIEQTGAYTGAIIEAKGFKWPSGDDGIEVVFERGDGAKASFLRLGDSQVHAIMTCMKKRHLSQESDLVGPIGLILRRKEYYKNDGSLGAGVVVYAPFDAQTKKTAVEILENKPAEFVDSVIPTLTDIKAKAKPVDPYQSGEAPSSQFISSGPFSGPDTPEHQDPYNMGGHGPAPAAPADAFDQDIPF